MSGVYLCMHVCMYVYICTCKWSFWSVATMSGMQFCVHACVNMHMQVARLPHIHTHIHTYIHTQGYRKGCMGRLERRDTPLSIPQLYIHTYTHTQVPQGLRGPSGTLRSVSLHTSTIHTYIHIYTHIHTHRYRKGCVGRLERRDPSLSVASIMLNPTLDLNNNNSAQTKSDTNKKAVAGIVASSSPSAAAPVTPSYNMNTMYAKQLFMTYPATETQPAGSLPLSDYVWLSNYA
jgi:hypothetical protein